MRKLIYILFLLPLFAAAQNYPDLMLASLQQAGGGGALYDGQNAADPDNEVNGTANFSVVSGLSLSVESTTTHDGSYAVKITRTVAEGDIRVVQATMVGVLDNDDVDITLHSNETVGNAFQMRATTGGGWTTLTAVGFIGTGYTEHTLSGVIATQDDPFIEIRSLIGSENNDVVLIDNIIITIN